MSQKYIIELIPVNDILNEFSFYCLRGDGYDKLVSSVSSVVEQYKYSDIKSEIFTDLKTACEIKGWSYHTLNDNTTPFRIGRHNIKENYFEEDLKGNLNDDQVMRVFKEIDSLRNQKKLL